MGKKGQKPPAVPAASPEPTPETLFGAGPAAPPPARVLPVLTPGVYPGSVVHTPRPAAVPPLAAKAKQPGAGRWRGAGELIRARRCRHGVMLYLRHDAVIGRQLDLYGEKGEDEQRMLDRLVGPGDVVVDAGASIGAHAVPLARRVGPGGMVHAFEPQRFIFSILAANLVLNELPQGRAHHAAVGAAPGTIEVPTIDHGSRDDFGGLSLDGASRARVLDSAPREQVRLTTVDALGLDRLRLLKIDVEGMERAVLLGARETIERCRPVLYFTADRRDRNQALFTTAFELGYRLWWHLAPLFNPLNFAGNADDVFPDMVSFNVLGMPGETDPAFAGGTEVTSPSQIWPLP